jgi:hypothetical protein
LKFSANPRKGWDVAVNLVWLRFAAASVSKMGDTVT